MKSNLTLGFRDRVWRVQGERCKGEEEGWKRGIDWGTIEAKGEGRERGGKREGKDRGEMEWERCGREQG